jgi:threonine/homoserine/homoserine lactone efflux protein
VAEDSSARHTPWMMFRTGFLVSMSNPKAFIFFTALFPQFMDARLPQGPQLAVLAATFYVIEASWQFAYASGGARLAGWLNSARRLKLVNQVSGGALSVPACCCPVFPATRRLALPVFLIGLPLYHGGQSPI